MANPADNLAILKLPRSVDRTHGFAAAVDRRATWAEQLMTRRPLGFGGASANLVHDFTGMGASSIGAWAARLAERYGTGERAVERTSDLSLASPAPRRVARSSSASAWAPQLTRDLAETRSGDVTPDLARSFASGLSAHGWPVQPEASAPSSARQTDPLPPTRSSVSSAVSRVMPALDEPLLSAAMVRPPNERAAASPPSAESGRLYGEAGAPPAVSRAAEPAQSPSPADVMPTVPRLASSPGPLTPSGTDAPISEGVTERIPAMPVNAPTVARQAEAGRDPAKVERAAPAVSSASAVSGASRSEAPLALPMVTQRPTALMRQAAPDPLARMGFRTIRPPLEPAARLGLSAPSVLARSAAPTPDAPSAPTQPAQPLVELPAEESSPAAGSTSAQPPEQLFAGNEASAPAPISAGSDSPPQPFAERPLPGVLAASIVQRLVAPTNSTVAQLPALRTWAPGPSTMLRGSDAVSSSPLPNAGASVSAAPPIARAPALAPLARPAIIPPALMASAIRPNAPSDLSALPASTAPQEPTAPAQSRLKPPAEQIEWGSLPLVHRALEHTAALSASASAGPMSLPIQIVRRQAAFAPVALAASANAVSQPAQRAPGQAEAPVADREFVASQPQASVPAAVFEQPELSMLPARQPSGIDREMWLTPELPLREHPIDVDVSRSYSAQRRAAELPLAPRGAARAPDPSASPATYLRELGEAPEFGGFTPALQRAPALDAADASSIPAAGAAPAPGAAPSVGSPPIDELARKVYDYLRRELRVEQERAGWRSW